ncbi:MAG: vWA domain-containing protein [Desulfohalobiaceae bacterium]
MFVDFFYLLRESGVSVSPTAFLRLQKALSLGLVNSLEEFYTAARCILIKSERQFDLYDQAFAHYFQGGEPPDLEGLELSQQMQDMLRQWLGEDPEGLAQALDLDPEQVASMSAQELLEYFQKRLQEQEGEHHGGNKWIGTRGTSPTGHSGYHPGGMRVGGASRNKSALKVAMDRRYQDYSDNQPLTKARVGEALKSLRNLVPAGPKDVLNIEETIRQTMKNAGELELVYERGLKDKLKLVLAIDNGGWSMDPYVQVVRVLFAYARAQFKDIKTFYFHNTIYDFLWEDPPRRHKPYRVDDLVRLDPETRFILVGDASMAPYELMAADGSIHVEEKSGLPSLERLRFIAQTFPYSVWLNPVPKRYWDYTRTIAMIRQIFPMFELTVSGLEQAVQYLRGRPG